LKNLQSPPTDVTERTSERGFSLIEVLVAALLLMVIALGLIPLFTRAMLDNANGRDATSSTNFDRSQIEALNAIPFDYTVKTLVAGQPYLQTDAYFSRGTLNVDNDSGEGWQAGVPSNPAAVRWTRRTRIRQYQAVDIKDGVIDKPLPGGTDDAFVQLKEVEVMIQGTNQSLTSVGNLLGGGPQVTFRKLAAF